MGKTVPLRPADGAGAAVSQPFPAPPIPGTSGLGGRQWPGQAVSDVSSPFSRA